VYLLQVFNKSSNYICSANIHTLFVYVVYPLPVTGTRATAIRSRQPGPDLLQCQRLSISIVRTQQNKQELQLTIAKDRTDFTDLNLY